MAQATRIISDAAEITYTPATATDWDSNADPGDVDDALDQLAARVTSTSHSAVTLASDADTLLGVTGQQLTLDVQNANKVFAGPTTGADADPTFRALVAADLPASTKKRQVIFTVEGVVATATGVLRMPNQLGVTLTIIGVYLHITTAPTGADLTVDIHLDNTTIFTTQSNRPHIDAGAYSGNSTTVENATWADGHYVTMDVDQVGSTISGSDLTVTVVATE